MGTSTAPSYDAGFMAQLGERLRELRLRAGLSASEAGKRANVVVLDRDIVTCPTDDIRSAQVLRTYVDGECAYRRPVAAAAI